MQGSVVFGIDTPEKELVIGDACLLKRNLHSGRFSGQGLALLLLTLGEYSLGVLTHGPTLLVLDGGPNPIVESVRGALTSDNLTDAFDWGNVHSEDTDRIVSAANSMSDEEKKALQLGMIIGRARRLQAVADPAMPLAILCANTAWELGE
jgi:hypothetical protein